jgi:hypothetical protein
MRNAFGWLFLLLLALLCFWVAFTGHLGSLLAAFLAPGDLQNNPGAS